MRTLQKVCLSCFIVNINHKTYYLFCTKYFKYFVLNFCFFQSYLFLVITNYLKKIKEKSRKVNTIIIVYRANMKMMGTFPDKGISTGAIDMNIRYALNEPLINLPIFHPSCIIIITIITIIIITIVMLRRYKAEYFRHLGKCLNAPLIPLPVWICQIQ